MLIQSIQSSSLVELYARTKARVILNTRNELRHRNWQKLFIFAIFFFQLDNNETTPGASGVKVAASKPDSHPDDSSGAVGPACSAAATCIKQSAVTTMAACAGTAGHIATAAATASISPGPTTAPKEPAIKVPFGIHLAYRKCWTFWCSCNL